MLKPKPPVVEGPEASSQIQALEGAVRKKDAPHDVTGVGTILFNTQG